MNFRYILLSFVTFLYSHSFAWDTGHNLHIEWVFNYLPQEIQNFWTVEQKDKIIKHWSHYPDGPAYGKHHISPEEAKIMEDDYSWIKDATEGGLRDRIHRAKGKGVMFFALAKAFRENRPEAASIYAGALLHSYADGGAFNHGSVMQYLFYSQYSHVKYPKLWYKDLWNIRDDKKILSDAKSIIGNFKVNTKAKNLEDALIDTMMTGAVSAKFLATVEADIGKVNPDGSPCKEAAIAITKTLATQTMEGANLITDAWLIAKSNQPLNPANLDLAWKRDHPARCPVYWKFVKKEKEFFKARDPRDDNVYQGLWEEMKYPAIGFVAEAAYDMHMGDLGFGSRFATAIIARGLKKNGANIKLFSFLDLEKSAPSVKDIPVLVLHAKEGVPNRIKNAIDTYLKEGGKLLFIGGDDKGLTGIETKKHKFPELFVSWQGYINQKKYESIALKMKIELLPPLTKASKDKILTPRANPNKTGSWNLAWADCALICDKATMPLMYLDLGTGSKYCVGAAKKVNGKYKFVYLPAYAFLPFIFSNDTHMEDWSQATTDTFGSALAVESIKILLDKKL